MLIKYKRILKKKKYYEYKKSFYITKLLIILFFFKFIKIDIYNSITSIKIYYNYLKLVKNKRKISIGIIANSLCYGGAERQTSLLLYYFNKIKIFKLFVFTLKNKEKNEYKIDKNIERIVINKNLIKSIIKRKLDILLYQSYNEKIMKELNKLKKPKIIFINRSCFTHWLYYNNYHYFRTTYKVYKNAKYVISLIHFENDYLFNKWGINSILMNNFMNYEYNSITPSDLSSKTILMIGRAEDRIKRFHLGIETMKYIIMEIEECEMKIISKIDKINSLIKFVNKSNLENKIKFLGYTPNPEQYYKNASLHLFPTLAEAFPNILSETLIYGIPNIVIGLDYVSTSKGGTIIIYDDSPISIAKEAIKILKNYRFRKKLGKEARKNMKKFRNNVLLKKWVKLIISIFNGGDYYKKLRIQNKKISKSEAIKIIENQVKLLKLRKKDLMNITVNDIENFTFLENLK